jgi:septal ring factor EnvC (AmiA/AmiB activator)
MDYTSISILTSTLAATAVIAVFVRESSIREGELREEKRALSDEIDRLRDERDELQDDYDELEKEYEELEEQYDESVKRRKKLENELEEQLEDERKTRREVWQRVEDVTRQKDEILVTVLVFTLVTLVVGAVLSLYLVSRPNAPVAY